MLRDTFAVELLLAGVPIDQVSILLGHASVKTTERHYAPFCQGPTGAIGIVGREELANPGATPSGKARLATPCQLALRSFRCTR